jgi:hypothetical protein
MDSNLKIQIDEKRQEIKKYEARLTELRRSL